MFILTRALFANNDIISAVSTEFERKEYLAKMYYYPNTWRGAPRGAGPPETWGPQRRGAQCNRIGCIGLRPALRFRHKCRFYFQTKQLTKISFLSLNIIKSSDPSKFTFTPYKWSFNYNCYNWTKVLYITHDRLTSAKYFCT